MKAENFSRRSRRPLVPSAAEGAEPAKIKSSRPPRLPVAGRFPARRRQGSPSRRFQRDGVECVGAERAEGLAKAPADRPEIPPTLVPSAAEGIVPSVRELSAERSRGGGTADPPQTATASGTPAPVSAAPLVLPQPLDRGKERTITVKEAAFRLGKSEDAVYLWLRAGRLRGWQPGGSRCAVQVSEASVEEALRCQARANATD